MTRDNAQDKKKKAYQQPSLIRYGKISKLTTGGSGMMQETAMGMMGTMGGANRFP